MNCHNTTIRDLSRRLQGRWAPALIGAFLISCGSNVADTSPVEWQPAIACPGDPSGVCDVAQGALLAGASALPITPTCFESWVDEDGDSEFDSSETFLDCGCDRLCEGDTGWPGADDGEGDGEFQVVWMAGFQNGRAATGVHDDLWARAIVLEQGDTQLALVILDLVGWFYDDVLLTRALVAEQYPEVDHVVVASTHQHEGPDTMGIWGKSATSSGYDSDYASYVREQTLAAVGAALADKRAVATMQVGSVDSGSYHQDGVSNLIRDSRDPQIIDERVGAARFVDADGQTIASLVNWGNHPEALADENTLITSDFSDGIRRGMEDGVTWNSGSRPGLGGVAIYINSTVGGLMTPLGVTIDDPDGNALSDYTFERSEILGMMIADMAMDALEGGTTEAEPTLAFTASEIFLPVENWAFQAMFLSGVLTRELYEYDPSEVIDEDNMPLVKTEIDHIRIGPLELLTIPGEPFPELAIGGYDGSHLGSDLSVLISEDNPNPPNVDAAPQGPYWLDQLDAEYEWIIGLGNDEVGYIIPAYDFIIGDVPYLEQAEGDHYEETNSLGPATADIIDAEVTRLMDWVSNR